MRKTSRSLVHCAYTIHAYIVLKQRSEACYNVQLGLHKLVNRPTTELVHANMAIYSNDVAAGYPYGCAGDACCLLPTHLAELEGKPLFSRSSFQSALSSNGNDVMQ